MTLSNMVSQTSSFFCALISLISLIGRILCFITIYFTVKKPGSASLILLPISNFGFFIWYSLTMENIPIIDYEYENVRGTTVFPLNEGQAFLLIQIISVFVCIKKYFKINHSITGIRQKIIEIILKFATYSTIIFIILTLGYSWRIVSSLIFNIVSIGFISKLKDIEGESLVGEWDDEHIRNSAYIDVTLMVWYSIIYPLITLLVSYCYPDPVEEIINNGDLNKMKRIRNAQRRGESDFTYHTSALATDNR